MEELEIVRILNKYNPWWSNKPIPPSKSSLFKRGDFYMIKKSMEKREIASIIGPRRVGKTVLIHQLIESLIQEDVDPKRILYLSVDEIELNKQGAELKEILQTYSKFIIQKPLDSLEERHYLFLDEIQELPHWEKILKNWQDFGYNIKFIISGSSSIWINKGTEESLLGRIKTSVMLPLKFTEYLRYKSLLNENFFIKRTELKERLMAAVIKNDPDILFTALEKFVGEISGKRGDIEIALNRYITIGGYPEFLEETDYSKISEAIRDKIKLIFFKDIVRYFRIRNPSVLDDLFRLLAKHSGSYFNLTTSAALLGIERPTLRDYLRYLTKAYLIQSSKFFSESRKKRISKQEKVYILDSGIRNGMVDYLDETLVSNPAEMGVVVEGVLFDHLMRLKYNIEPGPEPSVFYWKNSKEIDFILPIKRTAIPIESKFRTRTRSDTVSAMKGFIKEHKSPFGIVITKNEFQLEGNMIKIPLWVFLLMV